MSNGSGSSVVGATGGYAKPIVQVALDVRVPEEALAIAEMAVGAGVDWLEAGTPLILFSGIPVIGKIASAFPGRRIFADIKIVDGARKYVIAAASHGAHIVSVCGVASDATIREAVAGAREAGVQVCVDLYASPDPVGRAREVVGMGADLVYLHYGGDQWAENPDGDETLAVIPTLRRAVDVPIGFATAATRSAVAAVEAGADIVAVGHPFLAGPGAEGMLADLVERVGQR